MSKQKRVNNNSEETRDNEVVTPSPKKIKAEEREMVFRDIIGVHYSKSRPISGKNIFCISWNVNGIRATLKKRPDILQSLVLVSNLSQNISLLLISSEKYVEIRP